MTYTLLQSDLEFAAFLDKAARNAASIRRREARPRSHAERVMVQYLTTHQNQNADNCRCQHNHTKEHAA